MKNTRSLRPLRSLSAAVVAAAALTLSACGSGDDAEQADGIEQSQAPQEDTAPADGAQSEETSTAEASASDSARGGELEAASAAIDTAEAENGGTAHHIDWDDNEHWEIDVIGDREWEYQVSADGSSVEQTDEDDADGDDQRRVEQAEVTLLEALEIALEDTPGTIDDAELDEDDGSLRWEVGVYAEGPSDSTDIRIDAQSGDITSSDDDNDDDTDDDGDDDD